MITKKMIQEKIADLTEEQLNQVYDMIEQLSSSENMVKKPSLMSELQKISIDAPENFSAQIAISLGRDVSED
jgi:CRISPR/Cas system CSM-associated protein Csm2 small subunit